VSVKCQRHFSDSLFRNVSKSVVFQAIDFFVNLAKFPQTVQTIPY